MNDLIKRVESARGTDRELDFDIKQALEPNTTFIPWKDFPPRDDDYIDPTTKRSELARFKGDAVIVPHYTSSLDAAVSLCDRIVKPHYPSYTRRHDIRVDSRGQYSFIEITVPSHEFQGRHTIEPMALVIAVLTFVGNLP